MWLANKNIAECYTKSVDRAINEDKYFQNFKNEEHYNAIVGMSQSEQAQIWYDNVKNNYQNIFNQINKLSKNDTIGNPKIWKSQDNIVISPNTLRYINTYIEIQDYFQFKNPISISELGIGYGGLCFVLHQFYNISRYNLLDLPNVQTLSQKYLSTLNVNNTNTEFKNSDLFISEFCLSEFNDESIYNFYEKYVKKCKNIYLHMNLHEEDRKNRFLNKLSEDFKFTISKEFPKTHWPNYVIKGTIL